MIDMYPSEAVVIPDPAHSAGIHGFLTQWSYYIKAPRPTATLTATVWRPTTNNQYVLMGKTSLPVDPLGENSVQLEPDQYIQVRRYPYNSGMKKHESLSEPTL